MRAEIETFVTREIPVGHLATGYGAIENGMLRSEIRELWTVCQSMEKSEKLFKRGQFKDPMSRISGGVKAYPRIASELFYWRKGEGWRIKRKAWWGLTMKRLFPLATVAMK